MAKNAHEVMSGATVAMPPTCGEGNKSTGLGDTIARITKAIGIEPCSGCKERQEKLNEIFPYKP